MNLDTVWVISCLQYIFLFNQLIDSLLQLYYKMQYVRFLVENIQKLIKQGPQNENKIILMKLCGLCITSKLVPIRPGPKLPC